MTIAIVILMLVGYALICAEPLTRINKATVAIFCGVWGWVLYICVAPYYIEHHHPDALADVFQNGAFNIRAMNSYIYENVFVKYMLELTGVAIYLLVTMAIVDLLLSNACFDFIANWCRARRAWVMTWSLAFFSFILSANLDNLTATVVMLMILRKLVVNSRQRMLLGSIIVIATNCGGCFTAIGDVTSLILWTREAVTAANYSVALALPALVAMVIPTFLISRKLPEHLDLKRSTTYYRGEDNSMPKWQRLTLLILGILGLWFVPTFYRLTLFPPFLGALCVLGVLWVVNEIFNRKKIQSNQPVFSGESSALQYKMVQMIIYFLGIGLSVDLLIELRVMESVANWCNTYLHNIPILSIIIGFFSAIMDNVALVISSASISPILEQSQATTDYLQNFVQDGSYWQLISLCACVGGCLLPIGNSSGYALMATEDVGFLWYVRHISWKVLIGWLAALGVYFLFNALVF